MKVPVAVLGGTGLVGQQYVRLLENHPWFEVQLVTGRSVPETLDVPLVFSCLGGNAQEVERRCAEAGAFVVSNTSAHRRDPLVPLVIPEINAEHLQALELQPWKGGIVCKPNCSIQSYLIPLAPLHRSHGLEKVLVTTLQALSGAGAGAELIDNILPHIPEEEEKSEWEPRKILGELTPDGIVPADLQLSAHCNRVPTAHGHMACVSASFQRAVSPEEMRAAWESISTLDLPSAPERPVIYCPDPDRPQPEQDLGDGMSVTVGRLRSCPILHHRFVGLSHNLIRGAAGGGILTAELLYKQGYLP